MKKIFRMMICTMLLISFISITAYAKEYNFNGVRVSIEDDSVLLQNGQEYSKDENSSMIRGSVISFATAETDNNGDGSMTFSLATYAHVPCDEIRQAAFVEKWNEETQDWDSVFAHTFEAKQEDDPSEPLYSLDSSFKMKNLRYGDYYKLSGLHQVTKDSEIQQLSTQTSGVEVVKH